MAEIAYTVQDLVEGVKVFTWLLDSGDVGKPVMAPHFPDKSVWVSPDVGGTFGDGTLTIQGTHETDDVPTGWFALLDAQGNNVTFTSAKIEDISPNAVQYRPSLSGTTGADVRVKLLITTIARR